MVTDRRSRVLKGFLWVCGTYVVLLSYFYYVAGTIPHHRLETGGFIFVGAAVLCVLLSTAALRRERLDTDPSIGRAAPAPLFLLAGYGLALAGCLLLYWPALFTGFFYDDYILISAVVEGQMELGSRMERFRPSTFLVWRSLTSLGFGAVGLHFVNIALHAANAVLTYVVALRIGFPHRHGVAAAALFATFPTSVEPVAWMAGLPDVLTTTSCLVFLAVVPIAGDARATLTAAGAFAVALSTKETAIAIPPIAAVVYGWSPEFRSTRKWAMGAAFAVAGTFAMWRVLAPTDFAFLQPPSRYLFQKMSSLSFGAFAVPWKQLLIDDYPAAAFLWAGMIVIVFTLYFVRCLNDTRAARTGASLGAWIVLAIAPVYTWFFISAQLEGGRYLYMAAPAWSMLLTVCLANTMQRGDTTKGLVLVGIVLGVFTFGVRSSLHSWTAAAQVRDSVLAAAGTTLEQSRCERIDFRGLPETVDGAFVFRNGFREALEYHGIARPVQVVASASDAAPECRFVWHEERGEFVR